MTVVRARSRGRCRGRRGARAGGPAAQQAWQEAGGAGGPVDVLDRAALGADAAAPELQVQVLDVEGQELLGAGGGLIQHPPQHPLAQAVPVAGEQLVQADAGIERSPRRAALRRSRHRAGLVVRISCRPAQAVKDVSADRCRFQVAAAAPAHRPITAA